MGGVCSSCCGRSASAQYEPLLLDNERDAVADLLQYLESERRRRGRRRGREGLLGLSLDGAALLCTEY